MIKRIAHVCIGATDLDAAERFYCSGLGLTVRFRFRKQGHTIGFYLDAGSGTFIEVFQQDPAAPLGNSLVRHFCLEVDDIEQARTRLEQAGFQPTPKKLGCDGSWQSWVKDPSGLSFELHEYTAKSCQTTGADCEATW